MPWAITFRSSGALGQDAAMQVGETSQGRTERYGGDNPNYVSAKLNGVGPRRNAGNIKQTPPQPVGGHPPIRNGK